MYLISACLAGHPVRYDSKSYHYEQIQRLIQQGKVITACPELLGGLSCPRLPAEIQNGNGADVLNGTAQVIDAVGQDVSQAFIQGAYRTLELAQLHHIQTVVLKENSPSCGRHWIYDGSFNAQKIKGMGVTATLLLQHGFQVISENQFLELLTLTED